MMAIFSNNTWISIWLTLEVATISTLILLLVGTPLAWWLAKMRSSSKIFFEALIALPLVLPPTVLGFYLLLLLNPSGYVSGFFSFFGWSVQLSFSKTGLIIGSVIYSLPFVVQPLMHAFESIPQNYLDAAKTLRASFVAQFLTIVWPLSHRGYLIAATLAFAHTVGEFGVVLMIGGNIPGETQMVSMAIFEHVESLEYDQAHALSLLMLLFSLAVLTLVYSLNRRLRVWP